MNDLLILYRDADLIAVHKPAGLLVHRSLIDKHETRFAMQILRDQIGQRVYPLHRLDKPTSGVLLFALNPAMARMMMACFQQHAVQKSYIAVVRGYTAEQQRIDYPLQEELDQASDSRAQVKDAQSAITDYQRLATVELPFAVGRYATARYSLLHVKPQTGRKHQIRRHMKHIFHPIVGDTTHGDGKQNDFFRKQFNNQRLLLAATEFEFIHPLTHQVVQIHAALEDNFQQILRQLGWRYEVQDSCDCHGVDLGRL